MSESCCETNLVVLNERDARIAEHGYQAVERKSPVCLRSVMREFFLCACHRAEDACVGDTCAGDTCAGNTCAEAICA